MRDLPSLVYAAPVFLVLSGLEAFALRKRRPVRLADFASGVGCTILDQIVHAPTVVVFLAAYGSIHARFGVAAFGGVSVLGWIVAVLAHDLAYYAFHVASHRINVLWAAHVVHHEGEDYNFDVSWRQGAVATLVSYAFYLPLALFVPPATFLVVHLVYQVHQFLVHTSLVGRLGPLEWIVATPRIHRLHHGRDARYLDRNYGGFLCLWDRLFGTFVADAGEPDYGVTDGMRTWNPYAANVHFFARLWRESRAAKGTAAALRVWLGSPSSLAKPTAVPARYDASVEPGMRAYLLAQLGVVVLAAFVALGAPHAWNVRLPAAIFVLVSLATLPAFLDRRPWATRAEWIRIALVTIGATAAWAAGALSFPFEALAWSIASALALVGSIARRRRESLPVP